jgi:hypothetical protein
VISHQQEDRTTAYQIWGSKFIFPKGKKVFKVFLASMVHFKVETRWNEVERRGFLNINELFNPPNLNLHLIKTCRAENRSEECWFLSLKKVLWKYIKFYIMPVATVVTLCYQNCNKLTAHSLTVCGWTIDKVWFILWLIDPETSFFMHACMSKSERVLRVNKGFLNVNDVVIK